MLSGTTKSLPHVRPSTAPTGPVFRRLHPGLRYRSSFVTFSGFSGTEQIGDLFQDASSP
jgi:hypothetical protein